MSETKKTNGAGSHTTTATSEYLQHSYKPNEGGLKPNPPKKPSSPPNPQKK